MAYTTIKKPSDYFNTKLYTGNGSTQSITGVGFQSDWTWIKPRSTTGNHRITDAVRGATKQIYADLTNAENTNTNGLTAFGTDGFTVGSDSGYNGNGVTFASWNWLGANGTSANTDGSISSTVSANTTSGFSIVSWTGSGANATIGHGLGAEPKMIFLKIRTGTNNWQVYNKSIGSGNALFLNTTDASSSNTGWQSTDATSSVFYVSGGGAVNGSGQDLIAYCFAEKKGFSKFGSYTGNGNADGTFVYTGFKPAFVISKASSTTSNWHMWDNKRDIDNVIEHILWSNLANAEITSGYTPIDFLSNGFKMRDNNGAWNGSGTTYIYMCFAENPFVTSTSVPATAR